jgi:hypothetical protein
MDAVQALPTDPRERQLCVGSLRAAKTMLELAAEDELKRPRAAASENVPTR